MELDPTFVLDNGTALSHILETRQRMGLSNFRPLEFNQLSCVTPAIIDFKAHKLDKEAASAEVREVISGGFKTSRKPQPKVCPLH